MRSPRDPRETPEHASLLQSVLEWLERHVDRLAPYDCSWAHQLVAGLLDDLSEAEFDGGLRFAWTAHGLDREDVGPVIVLLWPAGAALAYTPSRESRRRSD